MKRRLSPQEKKRMAYDRAVAGFKLVHFGGENWAR